MNNSMYRIERYLVLMLSVFLSSHVQGQDHTTTPINLTDLNAFINPAKNWKIVGNISGSYADAEPKSTKGTGILLNDYNTKIQYKEGVNLFTKIEHGDIFLSLDFLMPKGSNSGIFLQGRYEIQLADSWLQGTPSGDDCGSIYERWDDKRTAGQQGYEGHPAQRNASFAPNIWQHLEVEFKAPTFDTSGKRLKPARFVKVMLNGEIIQENVIIFGPTRASAFTNESASGPLMIQGDHGVVAFRNIEYAMLNTFDVKFSDVKCTYYEGLFTSFDQLTKDKITSTGEAEAIDVKLAEDPNALGLTFSGTLHIDQPDRYQFTVQRNGMAKLIVDGETIAESGRQGAKQLATGDHTLIINYIKNNAWGPAKLGLFISKSNARPVPLHVVASVPSEAPAPLISVNPNHDPEVVRSFMMHGNNKKTHVISVGDPSGINYAYDLDQAALLYVWRGKFLNVTEMWHERGEPQLASPLTAALTLKQEPVVGIAASSTSKDMLPDSLLYGTDFTYLGYTLNENRLPVYDYRYKGVDIKDAMQPMATREGLTRAITIGKTNGQTIYVRLAVGKSINKVGENIFAIDNQSYYIKLPASLKAKPEIRSAEGREELVVPCADATTIEFSLIW